MKKISEYFGTKTAVKCENAQQWKTLVELTGCGNAAWFKESKDGCFSLNRVGNYWSVENEEDIKARGYTVLPYSDFVSDVPELVGVEMEVSNDSKNWHKDLVLGKHRDYYITPDDNFKFARPIQTTIELTLEEVLKEVAEKRGVDKVILKEQ
jgi:hypothetical protein